MADDNDRSRTAGFFALTFAITWSLQAPSTLATLGAIAGPAEKFLPLAGLGAFGPMLAAIALSSRRAGGAGVRALFAGIAPKRELWRWYVFALVVPGLLLAVPLALYGAVTGRAVGPLVYPPDAPERWIALVFFSFGEEIGWRGYALPRLMARYGALGASLIVGALWTLWHGPMFVMEGSALRMMILAAPLMLGGSVLYTWAYRRTERSLLVALLLHAGAHLNNSFRALPTNTLPATIHAIAYTALAALLIAFDRETFAWRSAGASAAK
jgi:membrane protease YdiL (CAAX protease family)